MTTLELLGFILFLVSNCLDKRYHHTKATLNNKLYDAYVKFFRWAIDRLQGRDGIVCYVSNNSFVDQIAFDGMRKHLLQDFTQIYHLDMHGNVRKNPKLSGTTHDVFSIQVGVGITVAIRNTKNVSRNLYYYRLPEYWHKTEKLAFLTQKKSIANIEWQELQPDIKHNWLTEGINPEFDMFLSLGTKEAKMSKSLQSETLFKSYSLGVATNRDSHVYSFNSEQLQEQAKTFADTYNSTVDKLKRQGIEVDFASLIETNNPSIKWTRQVKVSLAKLLHNQYTKDCIRNSLYRPYTKKYLYFNDFWNEERYQQPLIFPTPFTETENITILAGGYGRKHFSVLASNQISDLNFYADPAQCLPYYTYAEDGSNRRENITDWTLAQFREQYDETVTKWDIFHYVYAMLHHPIYRERYAENLKRDLPRIPLLSRQEAFASSVRIGKALMELHLNYETVKEYRLKWLENKDVPIDWRVEKMKLSPEKDALRVNEWLTLSGIPQECFHYRLGNRSALEWVIDQYQVSTDARSGIVSDPNREDDEQYIVRLVGKVITVSVETVKLVEELAQAVKQEDWMKEEAG